MLLLLLACATECTQILTTSVVVDVTDAAGASSHATSVSWSLDGGPETDATCLDADCHTWAVGEDRAGTYTITASQDVAVDTDDGGYTCQDWGTVTVTVAEGDDGCHVETEEVTVALDQSDCP